MEKDASKLRHLFLIVDAATYYLLNRIGGSVLQRDALSNVHMREERVVALNGGSVRSMPRPCEGQGAECVLERLPHAVVLVGVGGAVKALNERAAAIVAQADGLLIRHGELRCMRHTDTVVLHQLIGDIARRCRDGAEGARRGLRIHRPVGSRPLTALVTAFRCSNAPQSGEDMVAVFVNNPERAPVPDAQMLRDWYDLTPAEARVATLLASGLNLDEIVNRLGIGANTARTHLKSIFGKTDTRRQGELIRLLLSNPTLEPERARANIFLGSHSGG